MKNEEMIIIDKTGNTRYDCKYEDGEFYMPTEAIEEMKNKMTYDEAVLYFFNSAMQIHQLEERIDNAVTYIHNICYMGKDYGYCNYGDDLHPEHIINLLKGE